MVLNLPFVGDTGEGTAFSLLRSSETELFELVEFYFEDGIQVALWYDTENEKSLCMFIGQVCWDTELFGQ